MLIGHVLELAHNKLSHNGISSTYALLRRLYFWKGMKVSVAKHVKNCVVCQRRNPQVVPYAKLHFDTATFPMEFISMDLIGEFYSPSKLGYKYALTVICMLTGYVFCVPLKSKQASEVIQAYIDNVYAKFGGSLKILSDNGTEFKNKLFKKIAKELGVKQRSILPLTGRLPMAVSRDFITSLNLVFPNMFRHSWNGLVYYHWRVPLIISFLMSILRNPLSFLCLEEMQFSL